MRFLGLLSIVPVLFACARPARPVASSPGGSCPALGSPSGSALSEGCSASTNLTCARECKAGAEEACFEAAYAAEGKGDEAGARDFYRSGCEAGSAIACTNLGAQAFAHKNDLPADCALSLFESACAAGEPFGCGMVGRVYAEGFGRKPDPVRARGVLESACDEHGQFPCHFLGLYLAKGTLGAVDAIRAREKLIRACKTGYPPSCEIVKGLEAEAGKI